MEWFLGVVSSVSTAAIIAVATIVWRLSLKAAQSYEASKAASTTAQSALSHSREVYNKLELHMVTEEASYRLITSEVAGINAKVEGLNTTVNAMSANNQAAHERFAQVDGALAQRMSVVETKIGMG